MKKSKGQTIDLLYINKKETNKKPKKSVRATIGRPQKNKRTTQSKKETKKTQNYDNDIINLDNEIIIGLTPKKEEKKQKNTKSKETNNKKAKSKNVGATINRQRKNEKTKSNKKISTSKKTNTKKQVQKKKSKLKIIKWIILLALLLTSIVLFIMSSVFNIKEIIVVNNSKISSQEIINLSTLTTGVNMFKITNSVIKDGIKTNAYVEEVLVKRNINGIITLDIKERVPTYMLKFANIYVYINNQGYMLEVAETPLELPVITGFTTINEEIKSGNRLNIEDLQKLGDVIEIIEKSKNSPLANIITEVDIADSTDYKLTIESEGKTIKIGEMTNINVKLQMAGKVIEAEKEKKGEIYFQEDGKKAIFKEDVAR